MGFFFISDRDAAEGFASTAYPAKRIAELEAEIERLKDLEFEADDAGDDALADDYARQTMNLETELNKIETSRATGDFRQEGAVTEVILPLRNPMVIDFRGEEKTSFVEFIEEAKALGHDGLVVKNVLDVPWGGDVADVVVVFSASDIYRINEGETLFKQAPPVDSEAFRSWFKYSAAVDRSGEPLLLNHGSPVPNIEEFRSDRLIYATPDPEMAEDFAYEQLPGNSNLTFRPGAMGKVYQVYMSIQNPLDFRALSEADYENMREAIRKYNQDPEEALRLLDDSIQRGVVNHQLMKTWAEDLVSHLSEYGYDGLIANMKKGGPVEYAAVSPGQVRKVSVENNIGTSGSNILYQVLKEDIDSFDSVQYIKHDEGYEYDKQDLKRLENEISEVFEDIQLQFDFSADQRQLDLDLSGGILSGRTTSEVRDSWKRTKRIDFTGKKISNAKELAEAFSVYRNNSIETFHIIYVDDSGSIVAHNAISSGLPGFSIAIDSRNIDLSMYRMRSRMEKLGASGYYLMHNHPSGNINPSKADVTLTDLYVNRVDGFKGHIILDHTEFMLLERKNDSTVADSNSYSPVKLDAKKILSESMTSPNMVSKYISEYITDANKSIYLIVDSQYRIVEARPIKSPSYLSAYEAMRSAGGAYVFMGTSDAKVFNRMLHESDMQDGKYGVFRDIVLVGGISELSLSEIVSKNPNWARHALNRFHMSSTSNYVFDSASSYPLFQLSAKARKELADKRHDDVEQAVSEMFYVPLAILQEYAGEGLGRPRTRAEKTSCEVPVDPRRSQEPLRRRILLRLP